MKPLLSVVIPAYKEELTLGQILDQVSRVPGIRIYEVGISYYGRTYDEGKKISWKDGFRAIYCITRYGLFSRRVSK